MRAFIQCSFFRWHVILRYVFFTTYTPLASLTHLRVEKGKERRGKRGKKERQRPLRGSPPAQTSPWSASISACETNLQNVPPTIYCPYYSESTPPHEVSSDLSKPKQSSYGKTERLPSLIRGKTNFELCCSARSNKEESRIN